MGYRKFESKLLKPHFLPHTFLHFSCTPPIPALESILLYCSCAQPQLTEQERVQFCWKGLLQAPVCVIAVRSKTFRTVLPHRQAHTWIPPVFYLHQTSSKCTPYMVTFNFNFHFWSLQDVMKVSLAERLREHRALLSSVVLHECKQVGGGVGGGACLYCYLHVWLPDVRG